MTHIFAVFSTQAHASAQSSLPLPPRRPPPHRAPPGGVHSDQCQRSTHAATHPAPQAFTHISRFTVGSEKFAIFLVFFWFNLLMDITIDLAHSPQSQKLKVYSGLFFCNRKLAWFEFVGGWTSSKRKSD